MISSMIWMQLSAVIVFLGAAWNAELEQSRKNERCFSDSSLIRTCTLPVLIVLGDL